MNLSIFPDQDIQFKIRSVLGEVGNIFENQSIPVNYIERDKYCIRLHHWADSPNILKRNLIFMKLGRYPIRSFPISAHLVKLGFSRRDKGLITMPIDKGAEELRSLVYGLSKHLKLSRVSAFVPSITLGRVAKDLSDEECRNLSRSIGEINKEDRRVISFEPRYLTVHMGPNQERVVRKFEI